MTLVDNVSLHCGDCLDVLKTLPADSIDACVTDPPYHLTSIVKRFGSETAAPAKIGQDGRFTRLSGGFMNKKWDGGDIAFRPELWREVWRVLKPGAHLLACGGTRTYHRMACAIEDAGFEIRDSIQWLYGSGFPKSLDVSKAIDKAASVKGKFGARQWSGFGTALKPACEPIVLARKPLSESTVAANVLKWGCGALNIDGCRVALDGDDNLVRVNNDCATWGTYGSGPNNSEKAQSLGRWPANVIHDGSDEVVGAFPESEGGAKTERVGARGGSAWHGQDGFGSPDKEGRWPADNGGSAARFFYTAKADADDRLGSSHPTVKPLDLMQYLCRLVGRKGATILDPFAGTGTTGEAALREGMRAILIEREQEYQDDIRRRMRLAMAGPDERSRESIKAKIKDKPADHGPLFEEYDAQKDLARSLDEGYRVIRERVANGGPGWERKEI